MGVPPERDDAGQQPLQSSPKFDLAGQGQGEQDGQQAGGQDDGGCHEYLLSKMASGDYQAPTAGT
jgi:hypothetical protein